MWSAILPPIKGCRTGKVLGYYKKEEEAMEARKDAMSSRHHESSDPNTQRRRLKSQRRKINRMHTVRALFGCIDGVRPHEKEHLHDQDDDVGIDKVKRFPKYSRAHAWHPAQHEKARLRKIENHDFFSGEAPPRQDDHEGQQLQQMENTSLPFLQQNKETRKRGNQMFLRHNMLDMGQRQRYDRLDRERRRHNGPTSYNNSFQRQHNMLKLFPGGIAGARRTKEMDAKEDSTVHGYNSAWHC